MNAIQERAIRLFFQSFLDYGTKNTFKFAVFTGPYDKNPCISLNIEELITHIKYFSVPCVAVEIRSNTEVEKWYGSVLLEFKKSGLFYLGSIDPHFISTFNDLIAPAQSLLINESYWKSQLDKLINEDSITVKFSCESSATNHLSLTADQFKKLKDFMLSIE